MSEFLNLLESFKRELSEKACIPKGNSKLPFLNMSFPPYLSCKHDSPCRGKHCYAMKSYMYPDVRAAWDANYKQWQSDPEGFEAELVAALSKPRIPPSHFRYLVGGDVPDERFLDMAARIADKFPKTKFLIFTKRHDLLRSSEDQAASEDSDLTESFLCEATKWDRPNLTIIRSMWPGWGEPDDSHPQAWVAPTPGWALHRDVGDDKRIPKKAFICPGKCGTGRDEKGRILAKSMDPKTGEDLVGRRTKCWGLKPGEHVVFPSH